MEAGSPPCLRLPCLFLLVAITGWVAAARRQFADQLHSEEGQSTGTSDQAQLIEYIRGISSENANTAFWIVAGLLAAVAAVIAVRFILGRVRRQYKVNYGDGRVVNAVPGQTLLEVSRAAGVPHMSVCGGRARCSTCRTLVLSQTESLTGRTDAEAELLSKINADENIRLACQARVRDHVEIRPLIQPEQRSIAPRHADPLGWGVERDVAILFLDIRGFSRISEGSLPYDIVFILNSFFGEVTTAIETSNGYIDKFMGDGAMAIFGLETDIETASRDALAAASECVEAATRTSRLLTQHLKQPIRIGVGVHSGQAIIGRIGRASDQTSPSRLTAIGDTVNIAARLESATKDLNCVIVFSKANIRIRRPEKDGTARENRPHQGSQYLNTNRCDRGRGIGAAETNSWFGIVLRQQARLPDICANFQLPPFHRRIPCYLSDKKGGCSLVAFAGISARRAFEFKTVWRAIS